MTINNIDGDPLKYNFGQDEFDILHETDLPSSLSNITCTTCQGNCYISCSECGGEGTVECICCGGFFLKLV